MDIPIISEKDTVKVFAMKDGSFKPYSLPRESIGAVEKGTVIYTAGDSIVATYGEESTIRGWGELIGDYFDGNYVTVDNSQAAGGRTTSSFMAEGRLTYIINNIKAGDYLFVQFAHNDASQKLTENEFKNLLNQYIDAARANGAYPVFVTSPYPLKSVSDKKTDGVYTVTDELRGFPQFMREVAALHDVPVLDLNAGWTKVLEKEGKTGAGQYYVDDGIHYNLAGNNKLCEILISEISRIKLPLASCIK